MDLDDIPRRPGAFALDLAYSILDLEEDNARLRAEVARLKHYEADYNKLLADSLQHSKGIMGGMLKLAMTPGVSEALAAARATKGS